MCLSLCVECWLARVRSTTKPTVPTEETKMSSQEIVLTPNPGKAQRLGLLVLDICLRRLVRARLSNLCVDWHRKAMAANTKLTEKARNLDKLLRKARGVALRNVLLSCVVKGGKGSLQGRGFHSIRSSWLTETAMRAQEKLSRLQLRNLKMEDSFGEMQIEAESNRLRANHAVSRCDALRRETDALKEKYRQQGAQMEKVQLDMQTLIETIGSVQSTSLPLKPGSATDTFEEAETLWQCIFSQQSEIMSLQDELKALRTAA